MKKGITTRSFSFLLALILIVSTVSAALAAAGDTTHVSRSTGGAVGNGASTAPVLSADGRYIAFNSGSSNLVTGDTNGDTDVFVRDTQSNTTIRVSVATDGTEGEFNSGYPSISADGRYVAFHSNANNLVPNDTNGGTDVFVRDTQTNTTIIASLDHQGNFANLASSLLPSISADGRYVAFESDATLVPEDANFATDIYVRDLQTNTIHLISVASDGTQGDNNSNSPAISADGRYVAFRSVAYNLVPGDTNGVNDIFLRDRQTNTTTRISVATDGTQANYNTGSWQCPLSISGDGRYVVFESNASNLVDGDSNSSRDIFLRDTQTDATTILSVTPDWAVGNGDSLCPSISGDGRYVNFFSFASNLVANDTNGAPDVFVRDIQYGITQRVSVASDGTQATGWSQHSAISSDGSVVAFSSYAINLVASVTGQQVFKHELGWAPAPPPSVISIKRANANPTSVASVDFKVTFSQYVSGVDAGDFTLTTSGVTGASIAEVSSSGNVYTVTVNTGSGSGTIRLDLTDDDSIINAANDPLGGDGAGNGDFTNGEVYTIQKSSAPSGVPALLSPLNGVVANSVQPTLDWKDSSPVAYRYQVQVSMNNTFTALVLDETNVPTSEYTPASSLNPGNRYYWRVRAFNANNQASGWSTIWNFRTPLAKPNLVSPTDAESLPTVRPDFDWEDVEGATTYNLQIATSNKFGTLLVNANVISSEYSMTKNLPSNKVLYWRVRAKNSIVVGFWSDTQFFKTGNSPSIPALVSPANNALITTTTPTLDWGNSTLPSGTTFLRYEIEVDDDNDFNSPVFTGSTNVLTASLLVTDPLEPNTRYYWRVRAVNEVGGVEHFSAWSAVRSFRTALLAPELVSPSNGEPLNNVRPTLTWNDPNVIGPAPVSFTLQIASVGNFSTILHSKTLNSTSYTVPVNLPAGKTLFWRVRANGANGPSLWSASSFLTGRPPSVPALVAPANNALVKTYTPLLDWGNSTLPAGTIFLRYEIEVDDDPVFGSPLTATRDTLTDSQFTPDPALDTNTRYYWRVRAVNEVGGMEHFSAWSAVRSLRTALPPPALTFPANLDTGVSRKPIFTWEAVDGAAGYTIQISTGSGFGTLLVNATTGNLFYQPVNNLPANKVIYWRVRANGGLGNSAWSTFSFTTGP